MRIMGCLLGLVLLLWGCSSETSKPLDPIVFLPKNTQTWLKINNTETFRSSLRENEVLQNYRKTHPVSWIHTLDSVLSLNLGKTALMAWSTDSTSQREWVVIFKEPVFEATDSLDITPIKWTLPETYPWITKKQDGWRLVGATNGIVQQALAANYVPDQSLKIALKTANSEMYASMFLRTSLKHPLHIFTLNSQAQSLDDTNFAWAAYDVNMGSEWLLFSGIEQYTNQTQHHTRFFQDIPILPLPETAKIVPEDSDALFSFSLQDPNQFLVNQNRFLGKTNNLGNLVENVEQLSIIEQGSQVAVVLHSLNAEALGALLEPHQSRLPDFQEVPVYNLHQNNMLRDAFEPLLNNLSAPGYYSRINELFVFTSTLENLQNWISAYQRESTMANQEWFAQLQGYLISEGSAFGLVKNISNSSLLKDSTFIMGTSPGLLGSIPKGYLLISQINAATEVPHSSLQLRRTSNLSRYSNAVALNYTLKLEGRVAAGPFFLKNHQTGTLDIAVQDDQNQLYLFSEKGTLHWKKSLKATIQGRIMQLDLFKNGRLQMAFTTTDELVVLDRNGDPVKPFPLKFPGGNLNPLALFDYEQNRDYRFVVTQGKKVFMYDPQGKPVNGFKFKDAGSNISKAPQHMRIGNRDYLVFRLENGVLKILNRTGETRVKVNETFDFSDNAIFLFENTFTFTDRKGNLISIEPSGKISRRNLNLNVDHGMYATAKTLALMNDNVLKIKGNETELDLGVYVGPRLYYLDDIIYVASTDVQTNKLYLFRSTAEKIPGFPVEAQSLPDMADIDGDRNPELAVRYRDSIIAMYSLKR
ncbi:MAG: hypothetical protein RLZZ241_1778 [Bacteroidota bacterium]|jgi:hypothetical protein